MLLPWCSELRFLIVQCTISVFKHCAALLLPLLQYLTIALVLFSHPIATNSSQQCCRVCCTHPCTDAHAIEWNCTLHSKLHCAAVFFFSTEMSALCQVRYLYFSTACNAVYVVYLVRCNSMECSLYFAWLEMWFCQRWEILERLWVGNSCSTLTVGRRWAEKEHLLMEKYFQHFLFKCREKIVCL